ncbi:MAG TPA: alpha/beta hydrolase [Burkholderiaceae bacterium]
MALLVFSHGNGFPAGTYNTLLKSLRARGFRVRAIDRLGHDPRYPVTNNWPHLVQQVADFAATEIARAGEPAWLVGHSLGGMLSAMVAARHPHSGADGLGGHGLAGVVLLDAPMVGGWRATAVHVAKRTTFFGSMSPGAVSSKRRDHWPDRDSALAHFAAKRVFARWNPAALADYIDHGTEEDADGGRVLRFDRDVETAIYNTLPDHLDQLLRRHPPRCPVAFIGGLQSMELRQAGLTLTEKVVHGRIAMLEGTHLFPMEKPLAAAAAVEAAIRGMEGR